MQARDHILIVDDDEDIRDLLRQYLERHGFRVSTAAGGRQMRQVLASCAIDLIVLDLMMPVEDGLLLCRELTSRSDHAIPILMLTAKNEEADRILGLEMGADDYLTKPFASRELLARIRAILRRSRMIPKQSQVDLARHVLGFGEWIVDTRAHHLIDANGAIISLSGAEYRLLKVFLEHPQRVLTRDQLLNLTQNREAELFDRSIDILVSRLRKRLRPSSKLEAVEGASEFEYIKTMRSEGYLFACPINVMDALP